jgi:hypothetical protein
MRDARIFLEGLMGDATTVAFIHILHMLYIIGFLKVLSKI